MKYFLVSENVISEVVTYLKIKEDAKDVLHTLETSLHLTNVVPNDDRNCALTGS